MCSSLNCAGVRSLCYRFNARGEADASARVQSVAGDCIHRVRSELCACDIDDVFVSRFRSAEVLELDDEGAVVGISKPPGIVSDENAVFESGACST